MAGGHSGLRAVGKKVHVFAYNDLDKIGTPGVMTLLYRENRMSFPTNANQIAFYIATNPLDDGEPFNDDAFMFIWGRVDRKMYADAYGDVGDRDGRGDLQLCGRESNVSPYDQGAVSSEPDSPHVPLPCRRGTLRP